MSKKYFSALEAKRTTDKAVADAKRRQQQRVFDQINGAARAREYKALYTLAFDEDCFYPETQNLLRQYGYGVVCKDGNYRCWEISWDSSSTPVQGADSRRWNN